MYLFPRHIFLNRCMFTSLLLSSLYFRGTSRGFYVFWYATSEGVALFPVLFSTGISNRGTFIRIGNCSTITASAAQSAVPGCCTWVSEAYYIPGILKKTVFADLSKAN
uniref:Putative ixostatin n=1 Tax=Ixodes ricinus TaxID=34613 RepID=A0A0K8RJV2_IXORI